MTVNTNHISINSSNLNFPETNENKSLNLSIQESQEEILIEENFVDPIEGHFNKQNILFKLLLFHGIIDHEGKLIRSLCTSKNIQFNPINLSFEDHDSPFLYQLLWTNKQIILSDFQNISDGQWSIGNTLMMINDQVFKNQSYKNEDLFSNVYPSHGHILLDQESSFKSICKDGFLEPFLEAFYQTTDSNDTHNIDQLLAIYQSDKFFIQTQQSTASFYLICHSGLHEEIKNILIKSFEEAFPYENFDLHGKVKTNDLITKLEFCFVNGNACFILMPVECQLPHEFLFLTLVNNQDQFNAYIKILHEKPEQFVLNLLCDQINTTDGFQQIYSLLDLFYNTPLNTPVILEKTLAKSLMKKISSSQALNSLQTELKLQLLNFVRLFNYKINGSIDSIVILLDLILQKLENESVLLFQRKQENVQIPRFLFRLFQSLQQHEYLDNQSIDLLYQYLNSLGWIYHHYPSDLLIDILMKNLIIYQIPFNVLTAWMTFLCLQNARSCLIEINNESFYIIQGTFQLKISNQLESTFQILIEYFKEFSQNDFQPFYWLYEHFNSSFFQLSQPFMNLSSIESLWLEKFAHTMLNHDQKIISFLGIQINLWLIKHHVYQYINDILYDDEFVTILKMIRKVTTKMQETQLVYPYINNQLISILNTLFNQINANKIHSISEQDLFDLLLSNTFINQLLDFSVALKHCYQNHLLIFCESKFNNEQTTTLLLKCIFKGHLDFYTIPEVYHKLIRPFLNHSHDFSNQEMQVRWNGFKMLFWQSNANLHPWELLIHNLEQHQETHLNQNPIDEFIDTYFISFEKLNLKDVTMAKNDFNQIIQSLVPLYINLFEQKVLSKADSNNELTQKLDSRLKINTALLIQPFINHQKSDALIFLLNEINKNQHIQLNYLKKDYLYPFLEQYFIINKNLKFKTKLLKKIIESELRFHLINNPIRSIKKETRHVFSEVDIQIPIFLLSFFKKITENAPYFNNEKYTIIKIHYSLLLVCANFSVLNLNKDIKNIDSIKIAKTLFKASKYLLEIEQNKSTALLGLDTFVYPFFLILNLYSEYYDFNTSNKKEYEEINNQINEITKILIDRMNELNNEVIEITILEKNKNINAYLFEDFSIFLKSLLTMIISNKKNIIETTIFQFLESMLKSIQRKKTSNTNDNIFFELLEIELNTLKNFIQSEVKPTNRQIKFINAERKFTFQIQTIAGLEFVIDQYNKIDSKNYTLKTFKNDPALRRRYQLIFDKLNFILIVLLNKVVLVDDSLNYLSTSSSPIETPLQQVVKYIDENVKSFFKIYAFKAIVKELKKVNLNFFNKEVDFINKIIEKYEVKEFE
ncbi:MAG: hypothetical protein Q8K60_01110 [Parachlamydiaceae bacterium]|nr:hypothetical protein [Parachlamydiaceae bacterium]